VISATFVDPGSIYADIWTIFGPRMDVINRVSIYEFVESTQLTIDEAVFMRSNGMILLG